MRLVKGSAGSCRRVVRLAGLIVLALAGSARADVEADKAAIAARLSDWTVAFNARCGGRLRPLRARSRFHHAGPARRGPRRRLQANRRGARRPKYGDALRPGHRRDHREREPRLRSCRLDGHHRARRDEARQYRAGPRRLPPRPRRPVADRADFWRSRTSRIERERSAILFFGFSRGRRLAPKGRRRGRQATQARGCPSRNGVLSMKAERRAAKLCRSRLSRGRARRQCGVSGAVAQPGQGEAANQSR